MKTEYLLTTILALLICANSFSAPNKYKKPIIKKKELPLEIIQAISLIGVGYGGWTIYQGMENNSRKQVNKGQKILFPAFTICITIDIFKHNKKK